MDRDNLIKMLNEDNPNLGYTLIIEYCLEKGKNPNIVIQSLYHYITIMPHVCTGLVQYYKRKYEVNEIRGKDNEILIYF